MPWHVGVIGNVVADHAARNAVTTGMILTARTIILKSVVEEQKQGEERRFEEDEARRRCEEEEKKRKFEKEEEGKTEVRGGGGKTKVRGGRGKTEIRGGGKTEIRGGLLSDVIHKRVGFNKMVHAS